MEIIETIGMIPILALGIVLILFMSALIKF